MSQQLVATYSAAAQRAGPSSWLKLQQQHFSRLAMLAGVEDLSAMWYLVLAGLSARIYRAAACPASIDADGVVTIPLDFYVFPSAMDLPYTLSAGFGEISEGVIEEVEKEFDLVFDQQASRDLGYLADNVSWEFLTEAIDEIGRTIPKPQVTLDGRQLLLSSSCFSVLRVRCMAKGYRHTITMQLTKYQEDEIDGEVNWSGYSIDNLQNSIQATWTDKGELQSTELQLKIPPCIEDYLALCDDGTLQGIIGDLDGKPPTMLFYSTCTGNQLGVIGADDD